MPNLVLKCGKDAEDAASQPQLQDDATGLLKQDVTSLKVCLSGLATHIVTTSDSIACSQAYAGAYPESLHLTFAFLHYGENAG